MFSTIDFVFEKTPSETTMKSTKSLVLSLKLIKSFSLICEIFFTSFPNLRLFANNLFFRNSIKTDLFKVVYLNSSELNLDRFKSQIKALPEHLEETFFSIKNQDDFNKFLNEIVPEENPLSNWFTPQDKFISDKTYIWKFENGFGDNFIKWLSDNFDIEIKIMVSKEDILKAEFDYEYIDMTIVDGYKKYIDEYYQNEYESLGYEI